MPERVVGKMTGSGVPTATIDGAPRSTCTAGVVRIAPPTPNAPAMVPATRPERTPSRASLSTDVGSRERVQCFGAPADDLPFARVARLPDGLLEGEPPDLLHLVVVEREVSPHGLHQEERDLLADSLVLPHVPVRDVPERPND